MKEKKTSKWPEADAKSLLLEEAVTLPDIGLAIPVRAAKAKLSALLELVAAGQEVTITSDGQPKAVLSPVEPKRGRKVFAGMGDFLLKQPIHGGGSAEELIREDRDSRGW
ncbi:MAG: type II toxin-antitoxin system prevent-host-death family antitoxin [Verrucomicrobia bacterium]|nr:type II toxin-antitoxin system prevent-host-death family antitoxin [Verrucomicrobiota bacterium]